MDRPIQIPRFEVLERRDRALAELLTLDGGLEDHIASIPEANKGQIIKSLLGKATPRESIKAKCLDCVGFENAKIEIGDCVTKTCPLWQHRPYQ